MASEFDAQAFVDSEDLSIDKLRQLTKDELHEVAKHVHVEISRSAKKAKLVNVLAGRLNLELFQSPQTFDREIELAKIELEKERLRLEFEGKEKDKERELRKLELQEKEKEREFKLRKLELEMGSKKGKEKTPIDFDLAKNVRLVPKFNEHDVDAYFLSFEKIAKSLSWPEKYWPLLLQSTFVGKAQKVYATLSEDQCSKYSTVKASVLNAYELVPEAYRQKFRKLTRSNGQTFVEFARQKETVFDRWYQSLKFEKNFEELKEVVLMEEFKNSVPLSIKTHLEEHKITKLKKAAVVADDYELTHKMSMGKTNFQSKGFYRNTDKGKSGFEAQSSTESPYSSDRKPTSPSGAKDDLKKSFPPCEYCHKKGHTKARCFKFIADERGRSGKPVAFVRRDTLLRRKSGEADGNRVSSSKISDEINKVDEIYKDFVYCGDVSDVANSPVVILRDTGASQSLMLEDVLSLSPDSSLNAKMLIQGIGGNFMPVPLHRVNLKCDLFTGPVDVGVVPSLPMKGVGLLLGNDVAGGKVCTHFFLT